MSEEYSPVCHFSEWSDVSEQLKEETISLLAVNVRGLIVKFSKLTKCFRI